MGPKRSPAFLLMLVPALSITMLLSWGSHYYAYALIAAPLQADLQASPALIMGAYSAGLVAWAVLAYPAGRLIDGIGGRWAMSLGSGLSAVIFLAWSFVQTPWALDLVWLGLGAAMALTLYEPAFAVLVAADPTRYRRRMVIVTLAGGLASTVFWPLTHWLVQTLGWRHTVQIYAALQLLVCMPLHALALPAGRPRSQPRPQSRQPRAATDDASSQPDAPSAAASLALHQALRNPAFWWLGISFLSFGFVASAMATHMVPILQSTGVAPAVALSMAALIGPMQVAGRLLDLAFTERIGVRRMNALAVGLTPLALLLLLFAPAAPALLFAFAAFYGAGLGLSTIVRASAPMEVFGAAAYASISGALNAPARLARAAGPLAATLLFGLQQGYLPVLMVLLLRAMVGAASHWLVLFRKQA